MLFLKKIYLLSIFTSCLFIALLQQVGFINIIIYFLISYIGMNYIHCYYYGNCVSSIYLFLFIYIFFNIIYLVFYEIIDYLLPSDHKIFSKEPVFKKNIKYIKFFDSYIKI